MISPKAYAIVVLMGLFSVFFGGSLLSGYILPLAEIDNSYDLKRVLALCFIALAVGLTSLVKDFKIPRVSAGTLWMLATVLIIGVISGLMGKHPLWSMLELGNFLLLLSFFMVMGFCCHALGRALVMQYFFWFALAFSMAMAVKFFLLLSFHFIDGNRPDIHSLVWGFMNVRFFNQLQSMLMPILCLAFLAENLKPYRIWAIAAFGFMWLILLQSEARGTVLALISSAIAVLYFLPKASRQFLLKPLLAALALGTVLWLLLIVLLPLLIFNEDIWQLRTGSSGRIDMWLYILHEIPKQPFLGFGPMSYAWAEGKPIPHAHPHNSLMQILYEYGLVAFSVLLIWGVFHVQRSLKSLGVWSEPHRVIAFLALLSGLVYSFFCGVIVMPLAQLVSVLLFALNCGESRGMRSRQLVKIVWAVSNILLCAWLLASVGYSDRASDLYPRFWSHGLIK